MDYPNTETAYDCTQNPYLDFRFVNREKRAFEIVNLNTKTADICRQFPQLYFYSWRKT